MNLYGTKVENGRAVNGGNIYADNGTVNIDGSEITDGYASSNGGNIYNKATLTMTDGSITYGECGNEGGNVWTSTKTFTMNNGTISNGTSKVSAGNIMTFNKVVLNGGVVTEGTAKAGQGGNIRLYTGGDLTVGKNATVSNGTASGTAGNISIAAAAGKTSTVTIQGTVSGGTAKKHGGSINLAYNTTLDIDGGTVTGGVSDLASDTIYAEGPLNLSGACTLEGTDCAVYVNGATITVDDTFEAAQPVLVIASVGKLAAANTDKSEYFTSATCSAYWNEEEKALYLNGLIEAQDGSKFATFAEALASGDHAIFTLLDDHMGDAEITGRVWINLAGKELTGNISGDGTLYGYDTSSDDYKGADGRITGTVSCNVIPYFQGSFADICSLNRYMAIADETGYTFHRFYLGITHATINTTAQGVGYKAVFYADDATKAKFTGFGFNMQLDGGYLPYSQSKDMESFVSGKTMTLRIDNFNVKDFGTTDLTASVFLTLEDGTVIESAPVTRNMKQIVEAIDAGFNTLNLSDEQKTAIQILVNTLNENGYITDWSVAAITGWQAPVVEETPDETTDSTEDGTTTA